MAEAPVTLRLADFEASFNQRLTVFERRSVELEAKFDRGLDRIRSEMTSFKAELVKWMYLF